MRLRVREREGETRGFVSADSSLSTNACKPNSKSMNQTLNILLHTETVQKVCVLLIDEKGMERREKRREEGDSERVKVREGV